MLQIVNKILKMLLFYEFIQMIFKIKNAEYILLGTSYTLSITWISKNNQTQEDVIYMYIWFW